MGETEDAHASLEHKKISVRAAATRDLAKTGDFSDVEQLVAMATIDKSPSVRLYAAAAATAILMRGRGAYRQTTWSEEQRRDVLGWVGSSDPVRTPSLLLCYAAFPDVDVIKRLTRMLRDPRYGVRAGAVAALRRMALSGAATEEDTGLREWIGEALGNKKLPADAALELVRLIGETGWDVLLPVAREVGSAVTEVLEEAEQRCALRNTPEAWTGVWVDEGRDVLDETPPVRADWFVLGEDCKPKNGILKHSRRRYRRIWAPRPGAEGSHAAIQAKGRTWWRQEGKLIVSFVTETDRGLESCADQADILARFLEAAEGAAAVRAQALLWARVGEGARSLEVLAGPLAGKKPRNDLYFIQALALNATGDKASAKAALENYLQKAKKTEPWRAEAEELIQTL